MIQMTEEDFEVLRSTADFLIDLALYYADPAHPDLAEWSGVYNAGVALQESVEKYSEEVE